MMFTFFKCLKSSFRFARYLEYLQIYRIVVWLLLSLFNSRCFVQWWLFSSVTLFPCDFISKLNEINGVHLWHGSWAWKMKSNGSFRFYNFTINYKRNDKGDLWTGFFSIHSHSFFREQKNCFVLYRFNEVTDLFEFFSKNYLTTKIPIFIFFSQIFPSQSPQYISFFEAKAIFQNQPIEVARNILCSKHYGIGTFFWACIEFNRSWQIENGLLIDHPYDACTLRSKHTVQSSACTAMQTD